jgi:hypothetical protein
MQVTLDGVTGAHQAFRKMFLQGFGVTFFALGFVTGFSAVALRIVFPHEVTIGVFFGLLGGAVLLIVLSFIFFLFELRASDAAVRSAAAQSEILTRAMIAKVEAADARLADAEARRPAAGVR